ncbi:hypothetical protein C2869_18845 [Saccharobesus litoralis]|uniref:Uncharacterized protein n=1 Tax=Saccharobesus litoralis TaxID=2172099 RepID=A0A2S0VVU9_9ALTE|nr:AEC family transporter [Saccharobesus litoralis]AWB68339.1 hypothetical protein C2869_18845 [Saccharobesus litoralis]
MSLLSHFNAALVVTAPVLIILLAGILFKRLKIIDSQFVTSGSKLVFNVSLPCLLFLSVSTRSIEQSLDVELVGYGVLATLGSVVLVWLLAPMLIDKAKRGVFTQCAFRGNMGIIGIALCVNAFGDEVLGMAAVYLAVLTIIYNIVSVMLLSNSYRGVVFNLLKNPLIIAIVLGGLWSYMRIPVPAVMESSLDYIARLTLPLALLCIGASLEWHSLKANRFEAMVGSALKLVVLPAMVVIIGYWVGIEGQALGVLFLMMSAPTAAAAFVMSKQLSPYGNLAAEIVSLSTALSPITVTLGLVMLNMLGWI